MAYDPDVPPSLITQAIGGPAGMRWFALTWIDPIADLKVPGYISNAFDIGLRPGDGLIYKDVNRGEWDSYSLICLSVDANGTATMAFPEVPEEAVPFVETVDFNDSGTYVVIYQGGRQSRTEIINFAIDTISNASQAEAEAGVVNDKRMTPLRTKQAITLQALTSPTFTGNPKAPTPSPGDNDTSIATTAFVKAAIDVVLGGVSAAFDTLAEIATALTSLASNALRRDTAQSWSAPEKAQAMENLGVPITQYWETPAQTFANAGLVSFTHPLGMKPKFIETWLVFTAIYEGFAIGDEIPVSQGSHGNTTDVGLSVRIPNGSTTAADVQIGLDGLRFISKSSALNIGLDPTKAKMFLRLEA